MPWPDWERAEPPHLCQDPDTGRVHLATERITVCHIVLARHPDWLHAKHGTPEAKAMEGGHDCPDCDRWAQPRGLW